MLVAKKCKMMSIGGEPGDSTAQNMYMAFHGLSAWQAKATVYEDGIVMH